MWRGELAYERLQRLYEVSKLLTQFESVEQTIPAVIQEIARTLPLRSSILLLETPGSPPRTLVWQREGETPERLALAQVHASGAYGYLVRPAHGRETRASLTDAQRFGTTPFNGNYILLPLVVDKGPIFGALHLEGVAPFDELDLLFVNALVNQVAVAVDRHGMREAARALTEAKQAIAEAGRAEAELRRALAERSEERIRDEFAFARDVSSSIGEGVLAVDLEGRITLFNPAAGQLLGNAAEPALGREVGEVLEIRAADGTPIEAEQGPFARVTGAGEVIRSDESLFSRPGGMAFPVSYTCAPLRHAGQISGAVLAFRDIMDVKVAEKEQRVLADVSSVLASSLDYGQTLATVARFTVPLIADFCFIDEVKEDGKVERVAASFADAHKQRTLAEEVRRFAPQPGWRTPQSRALESGLPILIRELEDPTGIAQTEEHAAVIRATGARSLIVAPLVARGRTLGTITFVMAESGRRYSPADLRLAEQIGHRAALAIENARLYERAQLATRDRDDLLAVVSHDLKNPLSIILMNVGVLLYAAGPNDRRTSRHQLASIKRSADRMGNLIQDLLGRASIEAGHLALTLREVLAAPMLDEAVAAVAPLAASKRIQIRNEMPDDLPAVAADPARFQQVLANLLGNALKFTPEGGTITLGAAVSGSELVRFSIADTGTGIEADDLAHLFDRFWQARSGADQLGSGLGLFIVKGIVEAHGGAVSVSSKVGEGTTFHFSLPIASTQPLRSTQRRRRERDLALESMKVARELAERASGARDQPFAIPALVDEVIEALRPHAEEKNLEIFSSVPADLPPFPSDRELVRLILLGLVANAIRSSDHGMIEVLAAHDPDGCRLTVVDEGAAIPVVEERSGTFEAAPPAGIQLGLALVRELVSTLGGHVHVDSALGKGSTFTVTLPSGPRPAEVDRRALH